MAVGGGIVGQSQAQAINTFKTLDAMSPCIAIFDELEKGLAGIQSSGYSDAGTKAGVGSVFLKWIEKKTPGIYPIATCNNIDALPPEYKRAGRWDTIIGFDLPVKQDIYQTLLYYGEKWLSEEQSEQLEEDLDEGGMEILDDTDKPNLYGYSHAELMTIVKQMAMIDCSIGDALRYVKKIKDVDSEAVSSIRKWISNNAMLAGETYYGEAKIFVPKGKDVVKRKVKKKKKKVSLVDDS
jgi:SpoVK/Ycf46/Vps4 family AAA+-type ATPase